jgi:hypothetical protein
VGGDRAIKEKVSRLKKDNFNLFLKISSHGLLLSYIFILYVHELAHISLYCVTFGISLDQTGGNLDAFCKVIHGPVF